jgi:asparaginyl-tRNA synthetase
MAGGRSFQSEKNVAVFKIRAKLLNAARCWLNQRGYVEVHGPTIIPAVGDWPGHFEVKYFDKKAYLTQGLQPYGNAFLASLGKIYTIAPAFRAEKVKTKRHLTEFWRIEVAQRCDMVTIMKVQEELLGHICYRLSKEAKEELKCLDRGIIDLNRVKPPFPKLTYDEAIDILQKDGLNISWGQRIEWELENHLSRKFDQPFFITGFPVGIDTFFFKSYIDKPELTLSADLLAPEGYGEVCGGGQMIDERRVLLQKMAEEKIEQSSQEWYMNLVSFDCIPQSGFMVGLERLVQWICKLGNIKKATAFPRTSDSLYP